MAKRVEVTCDACGKSYNAVTPFDLKLEDIYEPCRSCDYTGDLRVTKILGLALNVELKCDKCEEQMRSVTPFDFEKGQLMRDCIHDDCDGDMYVIERWY